VVEPSRVAVVRNPRSGAAPETAILERALRSAGLTAPVLDAPGGAGFAPWVDQVAGTHDLLVAAGGDGTVSTVASAAAKSRKTLAVIPTGTLNHFARDAGIPVDLDRAAHAIRDGRERALDVGEVNGRLFLNNVSIGNYPRMVHERDALEQRGHSRVVASAIAIARTWWRLRKLTVRFTVDGRELTRRSPFIVIGNGSYALSGLALGRRHEISDGHLSLYVAPPAGRIGVLALPFRALAGTLEHYEQFEAICATRITAVFRQPRVGVAIDGEVLELNSPLEFSVRRQALRVLVPFDAPSGSAAAGRLAQDRPFDAPSGSAAAETLAQGGPFDSSEPAS
jgi:diacylglycerol kinase family enzyme